MQQAVAPAGGGRCVCHNTMGARASANRPPSRASTGSSPAVLPVGARGTEARRQSTIGEVQREEPPPALFQSMDAAREGRRAEQQPEQRGRSG